MARRYELPPLPRIAALYPRVSDPAQDRDEKTSLKTQEAGERAWGAGQWLCRRRTVHLPRTTLG